MMKNTLWLGLGAWLLPMLIGGGFAAGSDSDYYNIRTSRAFIDQSTVSTRSRALGGSYAALNDGAASTYENPAGLGAMSGHQTSVDLGLGGYSVGGDDVRQVELNLGGAFNLNSLAPEYYPRETYGNHTLGVAVTHRDLDWDDNRDLRADVTALTLAYGRSFAGGQNFAGLALAYEYADKRDTGSIESDWYRWQVKFGGIFRPTRELALGALVDFGVGRIKDTRPQNNAEGNSWHSEVRVGASYELCGGTYLVGDISLRKVEVSEEEPPDQVQKHDIWTFSAGLEKNLIPQRLTGRVGGYYVNDSFDGRGLNWDNITDDYWGLAGGVSYYKDEFDLGYTLDLRLTGEVANYFNFGYNF